MPSADQLKYMRYTKARTSRGMPIQPITYPLPVKSSLTREDVQRIVFEKVSEILYCVLKSEQEIDIASMSLADFDAFLDRAMCSDEEEI